jgi:hypothetical protein
MKSNQLIIGFLAIAVALFAAGIVYKFAHHGRPAQQQATTAIEKNATPQAPAPAAPTAPGSTVKPVKDALQEGVLNPVFYVQVKMKMLQTGLAAALNQRNITLADLDKLSFDTAPTTDPYNVFNPQGKINYAPQDGKWLDQSLIDKMTTKKGTPLVYNLRRVPDSGGINETLYAVIPNIAPANCGAGAGNKDLRVKSSIVIESDNHTIVDDAPGMPIIDIGCLHTPDQKVVWLYKLRTRYKRTGHDKWGSR